MRLGDHDLAQVAILDEPSHRRELHVETHRLTDEELYARLANPRDEPLRVVQVGDHRLRAHDVLPRVDRGQAVLGVQVVGRVNRDDINVVAGDQLAIVGRPEGGADLVRVSLQDHRVLRADPTQLVPKVGDVAQQGRRGPHVRGVGADHGESNAHRQAPLLAVATSAGREHTTGVGAVGRWAASAIS